MRLICTSNNIAMHIKQTFHNAIVAIIPIRAAIENLEQRLPPYSENRNLKSTKHCNDTF